MKVNGKGLLVTLFVGALVVSLGLPASAHGEKKPARTLVMQAIELMRNDPSKTATIEDLMRDALKSEDQTGVDRALLEEALGAWEGGDAHRAQDLLEMCIGAAPHRVVVSPNPEPAMPGSPQLSPESPGMQMGPMMTTGHSTILHERPLAGGFRTPSTSFELVVIGAALLALVSGGLIAWKVR